MPILSAEEVFKSGNAAGRWIYFSKRNTLLLHTGLLFRASYIKLALYSYKREINLLWLLTKECQRARTSSSKSARIGKISMHLIQVILFTDRQASYAPISTQPITWDIKVIHEHYMCVKERKRRIKCVCVCMFACVCARVRAERLHKTAEKPTTHTNPILYT